jgi:hypothetical protein
VLNVIRSAWHSLTVCGSIAWTAVLLFAVGAALAWGLGGVVQVAAAAPRAGSALPDGRAWEMVSPLDKNGGDVAPPGHVSSGGVAQASPDGEKITYASLASFGTPQGAPIGSQYISGREARTGWSTQNISTPMSNQTYLIVGYGIPYRAFSLNLTVGLVSGGNERSGGAGVEGPSLGGTPAGYENYYLYGLPDSALQPLVTHTPGVSPAEFGIVFLGGTPDLSRVVVSSSAALGEGEAIGSAPELYEWERGSGRFQPVSVLPDGTPVREVKLGGGGGVTGQAVSEDGSRVVWTENRGSGSLFVREGVGTAQATTVQADASQGGPEPGDGGEFRTASSDGSKVFFTDQSELTNDANTGGLGCPRCGSDLYEFDVNSGQLHDITVDHADANGAEVRGVLGASADGSYLYFVANGVLAPGATPGNCRASGSPRPGAVCNLYLWHTGWEKPRFIASLSNNDGFGASEKNGLGVAFDWSPSLGLRTARVSRDGLHLAFMSQEELKTSNFPGGYDNNVTNGSSCGNDAYGDPLPAQCEEVFLYEATGSGRLTCVSCNPAGVQPTGPSGLPGGAEFADNQAAYQSRPLSEGGGAGRVFFDSADGLVAGDTNGVEDVYEYENGHIYLLSDGRNAQNSSFVDASVDGSDVFFVTRAELVSQDVDRLVDLYDARAPHAPGEAVGFPSPPTAAPCEGEDCRPSGSAAPGLATPSSLVFVGGGNVATGAPKAAVKPKAKKKPKRTPRKRGRHKARARARFGKRARAGMVRTGEGM